MSGEKYELFSGSQKHIYIERAVVLGFSLLPGILGRVVKKTVLP